MSLIRIYLAERLLGLVIWICPKDNYGTDLLAALFLYFKSKVDGRV